MTDPNRPYPEGRAWDEAWRQRQRADGLEVTLECLRDIIADSLSFQYHVGSEHLNKLIDQQRSRPT